MKTSYMGALLLAALIAETSSFRILGGPPTFLAAGAIAVYVLFRLAPIQYQSSWVSAFVFWNTATAVLAFAHGILAGERYLWALAARMACVGFFFMALQGAFQNADPKAVLRRYAGAIFWLCVLNAAVAIVVVPTGAPPLFTRQLGALHPREYQHYVVTATEDGIRFLSFFDEPSTLAWLGCAAAFVYLALGERRRAVIVAASLVVSLSGSLPFVYGLLLAYVGGVWLLAGLGVVWLASRNLGNIFDFAASTPILDIMAIRFFSNEGQFRLSRSESYAEFLANFSLAPHALNEEAVDTALNGSLLFLLRYGVLYLPLFIWFALILVVQIRRTWTVNRALAFVLIAFTLCLFARESPLFNLLFWIPFEAIRRLVDSESPAASHVEARQRDDSSVGPERSSPLSRNDPGLLARNGPGHGG